MDEPFLSQKAFIIIFLVLTVIAIGGGAYFKSNSSGSGSTISNSSPGPSDELDLFGQSNKNESNLTAQQNMNNKAQTSSKKYAAAPVTLPVEQLQNKKAVITTDKGVIEFEIFPEAPKAASNFIFLTNDRFYDGLRFHRVEPGFVIQGGDPSGNGTGGPGYQFADEPVTRTYDKGIVAMANAGPNTNGSQFFIMLEDNPSLPKSYTIFGQVLKGQEVVDQIKVGDVMRSVSIQPIQ